VKSQFLLDKSEGQSLEDAAGDRTNVIFGPCSHDGRSTTVSLNDDDPLVWQEAVDQLRREKSSGPCHIVDGGGDASQVDIIEDFWCERPFGLSHVVDGGGDVPRLNSRQQSVGHWIVQVQSLIPQVELPTETRKKELEQEPADSEHFPLLDVRFKSFVCGIKYMRPGLQRNRMIEKFWKGIYEGFQVEDMDGLRVREFVLNDFLGRLMS
jgi:hypothetical protein